MEVLPGSWAVGRRKPRTRSRAKPNKHAMEAMEQVLKLVTCWVACTAAGCAIVHVEAWCVLRACVYPSIFCVRPLSFSLSMHVCPRCASALGVCGKDGGSSLRVCWCGLRLRSVY